MNSLNIFTHKCARVFSYLESVSHIINIPRLFGLYRGKSARTVFAVRTKLLPRTQLIRSIIVRLYIQHLWKLYIIATKEYPFQPLDNPSEFQGDGTSAKFVFLVGEYSEVLEHLPLQGCNFERVHWPPSTCAPESRSG